MDLSASSPTKPVVGEEGDGASKPGSSNGSVPSASCCSAAAAPASAAGSPPPPPAHALKRSPSPPAAAAVPAKSAATGAIPRQTHPLCRPAEPPRDVIFVTGFGPFGQHVVNASWQAVSRLHGLGVAEQLGAKLVIEEVPVKYEYVMREIPKRWRQLRPRLVVHVGVSAHTMNLQLERNAHNGPYCRDDVIQQTPPQQCCVPGRPAMLSTQLDLGRTCRAVGDSCCPIEASLSEDPGRYLCDFIYFTSLSEDPSRTVFVHVPPLGMPYTANQMGAALGEVVRDLYQQVLDMDRPATSVVDLSPAGREDH